MIGEWKWEKHWRIDEMSVTIFNYNLDKPTDKELEKVNLKHQQILFDDVLKIVKKLYKKTDLNIMIRRFEDNAIIYVTMYNTFSQR